MSFVLWKILNSKPLKFIRPKIPINFGMFCDAEGTTEKKVKIFENTYRHKPVSSNYYI